MILFFMALFFGMGCDGEPPECSQAIPCGFGEVCREGTCVSQSCATSAQCDMENYCEQGSCVSGCKEDTDCFPGDSCDLESGECVEAFCTDTQIDCDFKEHCNAVTGECTEASGLYCKECLTDDDCGGNGNICINWGLRRSFCGVSCGSQEDCPSGFTCFDGLGEPFPTPQCATYCWLYTDAEEQQRPVPPNASAQSATGTVVIPQDKPVRTKE